MADDPVDFIRSLLREPLPKPEEPGMPLNWWMYEAKSPERLAADRRAAYVLDKINERYPNAHHHPYIPEQYRAAAYEHKKNPDYLKSGHQPRGAGFSFISDEDAKLGRPSNWGIPEFAMNSLRWAQSFPTALYNTGQMIGNEVHKAVSDDYADKYVPYPEAYDQFAYNMNTLSGGLTSNDKSLALGSIPAARQYALPSDLSYWKDLQDIKMQQDRAATAMSRAIYPGIEFHRQAIGNIGQGKVNEMMPEGDDFLERSGVPAEYAEWIGPFMDSAIGLPPSIGPAVSALRAGKPGTALAELAVDYAASTPHIWLPPLAKTLRGDEK